MPQIKPTNKKLYHSYAKRESKRKTPLTDIHKKLMPLYNKPIKKAIIRLKTKAVDARPSLDHVST